MAAHQRKSKKQLDANSQPDEVIIFIDRSLGHNQLATSLRDLGESVIAHDEKFPADTPDDIWLEAAGKNGWIVLTHDTKIRYRQAERNALIEHNTKAFVLTAKGLRGEEIVDVIIKSITQIKKISQKHNSALIATITRSSKIVIKYP